ncbi:hypothetical protein [Streptomyces hydrogenans]|uniref:hypothetical protein n=1 Tax=Streptomyces hydrogenans TaxID=1873719 RepID=UPI0036E73E2D
MTHTTLPQEALMADLTHTPGPRLFHLQRHHDISGVSGCGRVADGVLWPDGTATIRWRGDRPSTVHWDTLDDAQAIHGHAGATTIVFDDVRTVTDEQRALAANAVSTLLNSLGAWRSLEDCQTIADVAFGAASGRLGGIPIQDRPC